MRVALVVCLGEQLELRVTLVEALVMEADDPPSGLLCGSVVSAPPKSRAALDFFFSFSAASYAVLHLG